MAHIPIRKRSREERNAYSRAWQKAHPESVKATSSKQALRKRGNPHYLAWYAAYRKKNKLRIRARKILNNAIRGGKVSRGECERCDLSNTEGHHDDYKQPLEVRWFCKRHHEDLHHIENVS